MRLSSSVAEAAKFAAVSFEAIRPRVAGLGQVDATAAEVERVGGGDAVLLGDRGLGRGLQRGLDLARASSPGAARTPGPRRRRRAATTSRCPRWPGTVCPAGRPPASSSVGVLPARMCRPGAVTSGLRKCPPGPREENVAITSPCQVGLGALGELAGRARVGGQEGSRNSVPVVEVDRRKPVVVGLDVGRRAGCRGSCPTAPPCEDVEALLDAAGCRRAHRRRSCR